MMERRVYVDFDDVLCETAREFTVLLAEAFGKRVAFEEIHSFNLGASFGLDEAGLSHLMHLGHSKEFLMRLDPIPGAAETLGHWRSQGSEVWIVTGRPTATAGVSREWLARHGVPYTRLVFVDKYARRMPAHHDFEPVTLEELRRTPFSLAVEDAPPMAAFLLEQMTMPVVLFDRPWNRSDPRVAGREGRRPARCGNWHEIRRRHAP